MSGLECERCGAKARSLRDCDGIKIREPKGARRPWRVCKACDDELDAPRRRWLARLQRGGRS